MSFNLCQTALAVPQQIVSNDQLTKILDTSDEWISKRTGIKQRHVAYDETTESLAIQVAEQLLAQQHLAANQLDLIVIATMSPTKAMPSVAATVQGAINAEKAMVLDVNAACTGFVAALSTAHGLALANQSRYVMVIGSEVMSKLLDWHDRSTAVLFGDGAGGVLIDTQADDASRYLADHFQTFGQAGAALTANDGGNQSPFAKVVPANRPLTMNGHAVYNFVVKQAPQVIEQVLNKANLDVGDVDHVIFHQANARMIDQLAKKIGLTAQQCPQNIANYGNTAAASEPILLAELVAAKKIKSGDTVLFCAFGGGLSIGAILIQF